MQKRTLLKKIFAFTLVVAVAGSGIFVYKKLNKPKMSMAASFSPDSLIEKVQKGELKESITASGVVYLADEQEIYAEGETNIINKFLVEEGDYVEVGQMLVEYDVEDTKTDLEKKIKEGKTNLENEQLSLKTLALPASESELLTLKSNITQAEKSLYEANINLESYDDKIKQQQTTIDTAKKDMDKAEKTVNDNKVLLEVGGISQKEYDDSVTEYEKTVNTYNDAVTSLEQINKDKTSAEYSVKTAESSLAEANDKLKLAQNKLSDEETKIKYAQQENQITLTKIDIDDNQKKLNDLVYSTSSTVSGIVTEICVDEGTYTEENTVMLKIADFDNLIVKASIAEYDAPNIELGQTVEMTSDGLEGKVYTGKIIKINPSASAESTVMGSETAVPIEISVDNPDGVLKPGYNLDLEILTVDKNDVLLVSSSAVAKDKESGNYYVYKLNNDKTIKKTEVEVGIYGETQTEIISGISEGDSVIIDSSQKLRDGMNLNEITPANSSAESNKENKEEGMNDDKNREFNQAVPPGGAGGGGFGQGMPRG